MDEPRREKVTDHLTQHTYDEIAPEFARVNANLHPDLLTALQRFIALVGDSARILDLGCGAGRDAAWMQLHGLRVIGADFSMGMLSEARADGVGNLAQMDMFRIGFPVNCFQGVWCNAALLHLPKKSVLDVLTEIKRVLISQGVVFVSMQEGNSEGYEPNPYATPSLERFFARYSLAEMQALLCDNGFAIIESAVSVAGSKRWLHFFATPK